MRGMGLFLVICAAAPFGQAQSVGSQLVIEEAPKDLGTISASSPQAFSIHLKNQGPQPAAVKRISVSCGCTTVATPQAPLGPGERIEIPVNFNPKGFFGDIVKHITVEPADSVAPRIDWSFKAKIVTAYVPMPKVGTITFMEGKGPAEAPFRFVPANSPGKVKSVELKWDNPVSPEMNWSLVQGEVVGKLRLGASPISAEDLAGIRGRSGVGKVVVTTDSDEKIEMDVYWNCVGLVDVQPGRLSLVYNTSAAPGGQLQGQGSSLVYSQEVFKVLKVRTSSEWLKAKVQAQDGTHMRWRVSVEVSGALPKGHYNETVTLETDSKVFPVVKLPVALLAI